MAKAGVRINQRSLSNFVAGLTAQFGQACEDTIPFIQELTPVDTKRLYNSTRAEEPVLSGNIIFCDLVAGGVSLYGENREQDVRRDVDYAYWVEIRDAYIRSNLFAIEQELVANLINRRRVKVAGV
jgi:hypothetical protein